MRNCIIVMNTDDFAILILISCFIGVQFPLSISECTRMDSQIEYVYILSPQNYFHVTKKMSTKSPKRISQILVLDPQPLPSRKTFILMDTTFSLKTYEGCYTKLLNPLLQMACMNCIFLASPDTLDRIIRCLLHFQPITQARPFTLTLILQRAGMNLRPL